MEKRDTQTPKRPAWSSDADDDKRRDPAAKRNPADAGQRPADSGGGRHNPTQSPNRADDELDELDDETSGTPGGNPARGTPPGATIPAPTGSIREHQSPGCEGLCSGDEAGQPLGERDNAENRPL